MIELSSNEEQKKALAYEVSFKADEYVCGVILSVGA